MARGRVVSFDQDAVLNPQAHAPDTLFSASWPSATGTNSHNPEPPRAPSRKPSDAEWEVPPLHLPTFPRKRTSSYDGASSITTREDADALSLLPAATDDDDEDGEEECVFAFDGEYVEAAEDGDGQFQLVLVGHDGDAGGRLGAADKYTVGSPAGATRAGRSQSFSASLQLGASPTLLSALERVAAEAGTHLGTNRYRIGTI